MHILEAHVPGWIENWGVGLGLMGEQGHSHFLEQRRDVVLEHSKQGGSASLCCSGPSPPSGPEAPPTGTSYKKEPAPEP